MVTGPELVMEAGDRQSGDAWEAARMPPSLD